MSVLYNVMLPYATKIYIGIILNHAVIINQVLVSVFYYVILPYATKSYAGIILNQL